MFLGADYIHAFYIKLIEFMKPEGLVRTSLRLGKQRAVLNLG